MPLWTPDRSDVYVENLVRSYHTAPTKARTLGHQFYPDWHEDAAVIGQHVGRDVEHGSAILARLSPGKESNLNRMMGYQTLHVSDRDEMHLRIADEASRLSGALEREHGHPTDESEHYKTVSSFHRARAGLPGTPLGEQRTSDILHAVDIRNGSVPHPLSTLKMKIGDFGHAIHDPWGYQRVAGDTHLHDAALGRYDIPYKVPKGTPDPRQLGKPSQYEALQDVHSRAYHFGIGAGHVDPSATPPNAYMGTVWYHHQMIKAVENPGSGAVRKATETKLRNYLNHPDARKWDPRVYGRPGVAQEIEHGR